MPEKLNLHRFSPVLWLTPRIWNSALKSEVERDLNDIMDLLWDLARSGPHSKDRPRPVISEYQMRTMLLDPNFSLAIIRRLDNHRIVATGQLCVTTTLSHNCEKEGELKGVVRRMLPEYKGEGLGWAISEAIEVKAREMNLFRLRGHTSRIEALAVYHKLGFRNYETQMFEKKLS